MSSRTQAPGRSRLQKQDRENDARETIRLPSELAEQVEDLAEDGDLYDSKAEVFRTGARKLVKKHGLDGDRAGGDRL